MKNNFFLLSIILLSIVQHTFAQTKKATHPTTKTTHSTTSSQHEALVKKTIPQSKKDTILSRPLKNEIIYEDPEIMAEFPGGDDALMSYLSSNIHYPDTARKSETQGRVVLGFSICTDGTLCDFKVLRSVSKELDEESLRVLKTMPKWKPGKQKGEPVKSTFALPIVYSLDE